MFYTYILKSLKDGGLYIGATNNLRRRVVEHDQGKTVSTSLRKPLKLVYYEAYSSEDDARHREQSLKLRGRARLQLLKRIQKSLQT